MFCIYCRCPTTELEAEAHVFPEGIVSNDVVLPRGTVCTSCNGYLGANLDAVVVQHPLVSFGIQWLGLRGGKDGRVRPELGGIRREEEAKAITIPVLLEAG